MNQFSFEKNILKLKVVEPPFLIRCVAYGITFLCFALPLFALILNASGGDGIKFYNVFLLGIFSLLGFYMLRISLWNHLGVEIIQFEESEITYIADYHWFRDAKKTMEKTEISYSIKPLANDDGKHGTLVISCTNSAIESVVKMPIQSLESLIDLLKNEGNVSDV